MPLYEYQCDKCGNKFEVIQKFSDAPLEVHPECGGKVVRLISVSGLHFKGSGFYITDYARNKGGDSKGGESGKSGDSGSSGDSSKGGDSAKDSGKGGEKSESKSESTASESKSSSESKTESKPAPTPTKNG
jgi:putative FmdB family regulatory protein